VLTSEMCKQLAPQTSTQTWENIMDTGVKGWLSWYGMESPIPIGTLLGIF